MHGLTWNVIGTQYCVQVNDIKGVCNYNKVIKAMHGWHIMAEGQHKKKKLVVFTRDFQSRDEWILWGKALEEFKLNAINSKDKILKYPKMGKQDKKSKTKKN